MNHRRRLTKAALSVLTGLLLTLAPPQAQAQVQGACGETGTEGWGKALGYVSCALAIVAASDGIGIAFAVVACGRVLMTELEG